MEKTLAPATSYRRTNQGHADVKGGSGGKKLDCKFYLPVDVAERLREWSLKERRSFSSSAVYLIEKALDSYEGSPAGKV